jgi:AbrB family looped-hinge helix DNA binding protein
MRNFALKFLPKICKNIDKIIKNILYLSVRKVRRQDMEIAKVASKGQITIPQDIRQKMDLKAGDKIIFFEENGKFYFQNTASVALKIFQKAMTGEAKKT